MSENEYNVYMESNTRIKEIRCKNSLTQAEFGEKVYLTQQAVSDLETGKTSPSNELLILIMEKFNVSIEYILGVTDMPDTIVTDSRLLDYLTLDTEGYIKVRRLTLKQKTELTIIVNKMLDLIID